jgi:poly-beta-1,6-N-acetyl-D-glucosamine N-deacetylase
MRSLLCLLLFLIMGSPAEAQTSGRRFVSVAFHDVVDRREDLSTDAVTADQLVRFFDWLKGTGWTAVSLDEIAAAGRGGRPLPDKAILLTFDDGYRSLYTRIFPLLQVYRYPAVAALVGSWMESPPNATVRYGDRDVPRSTFITWAEAREMQASGLVEFASHSSDMHRGLPANPQGNSIAAARTWRYDPNTASYEDDARHRARVRADLERSRRQMAGALGRAPRALVWPFGRFSGPALAEAKAAGFAFAFTLEAEPADAGNLLSLHRYFPNRSPGLGEVAANLRFEAESPETVRVACLALDGLAALNGAAQDAALGAMIENLRSLGANKVVIDGHAALSAPDASLAGVFFPTRLRPLATDLLSRAVWQIRARADIEVYVHLPLRAATAAVGEAAVPALYADMLRHAAADGIVVDAPAQPASAAFGQKNAVRARRAALDPAALDVQSRQALAIYRAAAAVDPVLRLMLAVPAAPAGPADWADYVLSPPAATADALATDAVRVRAGGWLQPQFAGRVVLGLPVDPAAQITGLRSAQRQGAAGFALCPQMPPLPASAALSAVFSAATFAYRP